MPLHFGTDVAYGCPYDCGLCVDHEQHSCLSIVEVTDRCNLTCPTCYAMSSPHYGSHRSLEEIEAMFDVIVKNEGEPDVVQISGGEPTIHPEFFRIMDIAKSKPIKHLMLNTNGVRIANDPGFAENWPPMHQNLKFIYSLIRLNQKYYRIFVGKILRMSA